MNVRMLTSMAGDSFSYAYGDIVEVDDAVAKAWIEAGIADKPPAAAVSEKNAKAAQQKVVELSEQLTAAQADHKASAEQAQQLGEQLAAATAQVKTLETENAELREQLGLAQGKVKEHAPALEAAVKAAAKSEDLAGAVDVLTAEKTELSTQVETLTAEKTALAAQVEALTPKADPAADKTKA